MPTWCPRRQESEDRLSHLQVRPAPDSKPHPLHLRNVRHLFRRHLHDLTRPVGSGTRSVMRSTPHARRVEVPAAAATLMSGYHPPTIGPHMQMRVLGCVPPSAPSGGPLLLKTPIIVSLTSTRLFVSKTCRSCLRLPSGKPPCFGPSSTNLSLVTLPWPSAR